MGHPVEPPCHMPNIARLGTRHLARGRVLASDITSLRASSITTGVVHKRVRPQPRRIAHLLCPSFNPPPELSSATYKQVEPSCGMPHESVHKVSEAERDRSGQLCGGMTSACRDVLCWVELVCVCVCVLCTGAECCVLDMTSSGEAERQASPRRLAAARARGHLRSACTGIFAQRV